MAQHAHQDNIIAFPQGGSRVNPQVEEGYIRIANELFDAILRADLSKREQKVVLAVLRKTYGYGKKEDDIASVQLADMCGLHPNHVRSTLATLAARRVLNVRKGRYGQLLSINKHYDQWLESSNQNSCSNQPKQLPRPTKLVVSGNQNGTHKRQPQKTTPIINSPSESRRRENATPPCPHQEIIALYHEILPMLPQVKEWTPMRRRYLQARWRESPKRQSLDWWRRYFTYIREECPFLIGQVEQPNRTPFMANLEWLVRPQNLAKVIERHYERRAFA